MSKGKVIPIPGVSRSTTFAGQRRWEKSPPTQKWRDNYDRTFGKKDPEPPPEDDICDHGKSSIEECGACDYDRLSDGITDGARL